MTNLLQFQMVKLQYLYYLRHGKMALWPFIYLFCLHQQQWRRSVTSFDRADPEAAYWDLNAEVWVLGTSRIQGQSRRTHDGGRRGEAPTKLDGFCVVCSCTPPLQVHFLLHFCKSVE
jgi:hypothetical protein